MGGSIGGDAISGPLTAAAAMPPPGCSNPFFFRPTKKNSKPISASATTPPIAIPAIAPLDSVTLLLPLPPLLGELDGDAPLPSEDGATLLSGGTFSPGESENLS